MKSRERPNLVIVGHFIECDDGTLREIDPIKTNLPAICKVTWAEAATGNRYELLRGKAVSS